MSGEDGRKGPESQILEMLPEALQVVKHLSNDFLIRHLCIIKIVLSPQIFGKVCYLCKGLGDFFLSESIGSCEN